MNHLVKFCASTAENVRKRTEAARPKPKFYILIHPCIFLFSNIFIMPKIVFFSGVHVFSLKFSPTFFYLANKGVVYLIN